MKNEKSCKPSADAPPSREAPKEFAPETESLPSYDSEDLLKGAKEILIRHQGEIYRLRLTRNGKLILNK